METTNQTNATGVQIFKSPQFGEVRTKLSESNQPLFCLVDLCKVLELNPSKAAQRLSKDVLSKYPLPTKGGEQLANFVNEDGLYDVILDSRKPEARAFRKWVTSEVLPAIRQTGGYIPSVEGESEADIMAKALLIAQRKIEAAQTRLKYEAARAEALQRQTEKMQGQIDYIGKEKAKLLPAAVYAKEVLSSTSNYTLTQTAHALGLRSVYVLTNWLKRRGILYYQSGQWQPTAKVADKGYFAVRTSKYVKSDNTVGTTMYCAVTETGRMYLWELLKGEEGAL